MRQWGMAAVLIAVAVVFVQVPADATSCKRPPAGPTEQWKVVEIYGHDLQFDPPDLDGIFNLAELDRVELYVTTTKLNSIEPHNLSGEETPIELGRFITDATTGTDESEGKWGVFYNFGHGGYSVWSYFCPEDDCPTAGDAERVKKWLKEWFSNYLVVHWGILPKFQEDFLRWAIGYISVSHGFSISLYLKPEFFSLIIPLNFAQNSMIFLDGCNTIRYLKTNDSAFSKNFVAEILGTRGLAYPTPPNTSLYAEVFFSSMNSRSAPSEECLEDGWQWDDEENDFSSIDSAIAKVEGTRGKVKPECYYFSLPTLETTRDKNRSGDEQSDRYKLGSPIIIDSMGWATDDESQPAQGWESPFIKPDWSEASTFTYFYNHLDPVAYPDAFSYPDQLPRTYWLMVQSPRPCCCYDEECPCGYYPWDPLYEDCNGDLPADDDKYIWEPYIEGGVSFTSLYESGISPRDGETDFITLGDNNFFLKQGPFEEVSPMGVSFWLQASIDRRQLGHCGIYPLGIHLELGAQDAGWPDDRNNGIDLNGDGLIGNSSDDDTEAGPLPINIRFFVDDFTDPDGPGIPEHTVVSADDSKGWVDTDVSVEPMVRVHLAGGKTLLCNPVGETVGPEGYVDTEQGRACSDFCQEGCVMPDANLCSLVAKTVNPDTGQTFVRSVAEEQIFETDDYEQGDIYFTVNGCDSLCSGEFWAYVTMEYSTLPDEYYRLYGNQASWQPTKFIIDGGPFAETLTVVPVGTVALDAQGTQTGPAGVSDLPCGSACLLETAPYGMLIGKVGPEGTPFEIGAYAEQLPLTETGRLYLAVNDYSWSENGGEYFVHIMTDYVTNDDDSVDDDTIDDDTWTDDDTVIWIDDDTWNDDDAVDDDTTDDDVCDDDNTDDDLSDDDTTDDDLTDDDGSSDDDTSDDDTAVAPCDVCANEAKMQMGIDCGMIGDGATAPTVAEAQAQCEAICDAPENEMPLGCLNGKSTCDSLYDCLWPALFQHDLCDEFVSSTAPDYLAPVAAEGSCQGNDRLGRTRYEWHEACSNDNVSHYLIDCWKLAYETGGEDMCTEFVTCANTQWPDDDTVDDDTTDDDTTEDDTRDDDTNDEYAADDHTADTNRYTTFY